ncbi:MAG: aminotransferase class I/II-fold pyridoxal phosphate-dependent enzyme [Woeseia sp.]
MDKDSGGTRDNPFDLEPELMRQLGYRIVDALVEHTQSLPELPVAKWAQERDGVQNLQRGFPERPADAVATVDQALGQVFGNIMHVAHPRFFAYIPSPGNFVSSLADFMASGFNVFAGTAPHNVGAFEVERATVDWLGNEFGWHFPSSGVFVSGGSAASFTALAIARHVHLKDDIENAVVYCSSQAHSCIERALFLLGFKAAQLQLIEPDSDYRLSGTALAAAIENDRAAGRRPFCVVGNGGTTNTGAIDPLQELADICERENLWFHIDAAYGGGAVLSQEVKPLFDGAERAHTIAIDPHKWLFQPFECACVLGRDREWFRDTFRRLPAYMRDTDATGDQFNYRDMSLQVTRSFKAFKLWLSLQVYGLDTFRGAIEQGLALARYAQRYVETHADWELVTPATLGVLTFRWRTKGSEADSDQLNARIAGSVSRSGYAYVATTELGGRTVLRLCPIHPGTNRQDIDETFARLERAAGAGLPEGARPGRAPG